MTTLGQNFEVIRGDDVAIEFAISDVTAGGDVWAWKFARGGAIVSKPGSMSEGMVSVSLTSAETADMVPGAVYEHELELTQGGKVSTVAKGRFTVIGDIR